MSWNIQMLGTKGDVVANLPLWLQNGGDGEVADFIAKQISRIPDPTPESSTWNAASHVRVEGCGHGGHVLKLEVIPFNPVTAPAPPTPPVSNDFIASGCAPFTGAGNTVAPGAA